VWEGTIIDTAHGGTGNNSYTANRLVYTSSASTMSSTTSIYADTNVITINGASTPANNGNFQVIGASTM